MNRRKNFFNLSLDMLCIADVSGCFLDVNAAFTQVLGYEAEELLAQPFLNLIHPDDVETTNAELTHLDQGRKTIQFENRYRHKDGHYLTLEWSSVTDEESGLIYAVARDITERVNLRNRLLQIERALKLESIVATADKNGVLASVNDRFCSVSGYSKEELLGRSALELAGKYHTEDFLTDVGQKVLDGQIWSGVIKNFSRTGKEFFTRTMIVPIVDHEGALSSYLSISQDITENIDNEQALARAVDILNETNSIARVGGWELNVETEELNWTDETFRILEVEKRADQKPILPQGLSLFTPKSQPIIERAVSRAIQLGEPYSLELEAQTAKGNVLWVYTNGKANYRDGKVVTLSGTIQDIHARKTAELRYEAEHRRVIHDAKLTSLGELAASMAHELNNPLGIATGYAELALETPELAPEMRSKLERILKSCDRMTHIVSNLKRFSRSEQQAPQRSFHNIGKVIREAVSLTDSRLKHERIELKFNSETTREVLCSEIEIEQVMINLINNSVDAVLELAERWIQIELCEKEESVEVRVLDSGPGIPESQRAAIFAPFYTTKRAGDGTGLGLAISREILEAHGAQLRYESSGEAPCFVITLPSPSPSGDAS